MSYEPTTWKAGDTVTSAKLNKMEQGIAGNSMGNFIVTYNQYTELCNKTWQNIVDAISNGQPVYLRTIEDENDDTFNLVSLTNIKQQDVDYFEVQFGYSRMVASSSDNYLTLDA